MGHRAPLNILDLNDFVLLKIFSNLTELEKYYGSLVCQRFSSIAASAYANSIEFDTILNKYFDRPNNDYRANVEKCYGIIKSLGIYWTTIRISYNFSIIRPASILKLVKKFCPNLEHLILQFDNVESKFVLNNLPKKLKTISLSVECRCRENWLMPLQHCVNLEHLTLKFIMKDNKKMLHDRKRMLRGDFLQHFPNLKILIFNGCRPSEKGLTKCFHNSINLSILELNCDLANASSKLIEMMLLKLTNLQRIKLQPIQSMRLDQLGLLGNLKYLSLDSWVPNNLNSLLSNLITSNRVQCFEVDNCQSFIHSDIISDLHKWTNLRYLHVDYMESFDDRFLRQLATIGNLNYFHFSGRGRNVSVNAMISLLTKSVNLEMFDFHIYYEPSDTYTPDTANDVQLLKVFQRAATERIKIITIYSTATSVHCTGGFHVGNENAFQRSLASSLNLDLSKLFFSGDSKH